MKSALHLWPEDRRVELTMLQEMVNHAGSLNRGGGVAEKIHRLAEIRDVLTADTYGSPPRPSFMNWIRGGGRGAGTALMIMAHARKDTLVGTGEWARHLRPWKKRQVAKAERREIKIQIRKQGE